MIPTATERTTPADTLNACTIVARNYLPSARVFAQSLTAVHPRARVTVLVIDGDSDPGDAAHFRTLRLEDVIPDAAERRRQTFMYDVTELSTAVKPLLLQLLMGEGAGAVLYFDPDIQIFESVETLWELAVERGIVLTPHTLAPIPDDGFEISDLAVLRAGVYNLGFIGVGAGTERFLEWWAGRLRRHCISDPANGTFVDQRWLDYVAGFFPHATLRHPGCNVAYWNLHERTVERTADGFDVNGHPLRFYHFSGFDPEVPYLLSRHQGRNPRVLLSQHPALQELCEGYAARLRANGYRPGGERYGFASLPDGTPVDSVMRRLFRRALLDAERRGLQPPPWPFRWDEIVHWLNAPAPEAPRLSRYLFGLYQLRPDLQREFPRPFGSQADAYLHWVRFDPVANQSIPAVLRPSEPDGVFQREDADPLPPGLNITGYFKAEQGVGEIARLITATARSVGIPVATFVNDQTPGRQQDTFDLGSNGGSYATTLVCTNADEFPRAMDAIPREMTDGCHRIGFWFWETEQLPSVYQAAGDLLDEVWVASEYVAAAVRATVSKPVYICPIPLRVPDPVPVSRAELGLPEGFFFLFMFDFLSDIHRKNPIGLVEAFCRAFRPGEGPTLVLKSINGHLARRPSEALRAAIGGRPDIIAMEGYLAGRERDALMQSCDSYISLHRSEGFGLTMAEAMAFGKPTIATAYSGNMDFMTPENSFLVPWRQARVPKGCEPYPEGDVWAQPDLEVAASLMRLVYDNPPLAKERGRVGRAHVLDHLSGARTAAFVRGRLLEIDAQRQALQAEPVPGDDPDLATVIEIAETIQEPAPDESEPLSELTSLLAQAERDAITADQMIAGGIPFATPSPFGWPGRVLRTTVLRLLRPYATFSASAHQQHLQATMRVLESLRKLEADIASRRNGHAGDK